MKKYIYILALLSFALLSFNSNNKKEIAKTEPVNEIDDIIKTNEGFTLLKKNCYVCHNSTIIKSHNDLLAPPMRGVKNHYLGDFDNKKDFVEAIIKWVENPKEENSLMSGAIEHFKIMPKMGFKTGDVQKIAGYMYDNELERPFWAGRNHGNHKH